MLAKGRLMLNTYGHNELYFAYFTHFFSWTQYDANLTRMSLTFSWYCFSERNLVNASSKYQNAKSSVYSVVIHSMSY